MSTEPLKFHRNILFLFAIVPIYALFPQTTEANTIPSVLVSDTTVKSSPATNSSTIDNLKANERVVVLNVKNGFFYIGYSKNGTKFGWVEAVTINFLENIADSGKPCDDFYTTVEGAEFCLNVSSSNIDCDESFFGGFDNCNVNLGLEYSSNYNGKDSPEVYVNCDVTLQKTDLNGWSSFETGYGDISGYGKSDWMSLYMSLDVSSFSVPVVSVKTDNLNCYISDVY
jgi:hypothetical protein